MPRTRKQDSELSRPRVVIAKPAPVCNRPKRATKDAFYCKLKSIARDELRESGSEPDLFVPKSRKRKPKVEIVDGPRLLDGDSVGINSDTISTSSPVVHPCSTNLTSALQKCIKSEPGVHMETPKLAIKEEQKFVGLNPVKSRVPKNVACTFGLNEVTTTPRINIFDRIPPKNAVKGRKVVRAVMAAAEPSSFYQDFEGPIATFAGQGIALLSMNPQLPYVCVLCGFRCEQIEGLQTHLGTHIEDIRVCPLCDPDPGMPPYTFDKWLGHINNFHFKIQPENGTYCRDCQTCFYQMSLPYIMQHFFYYCPKATKCRFCKVDLKGESYRDHLQKKHIKIMSRFVCGDCFLGFPTLFPFLTHICRNQYRCVCELTDVYADAASMNAHIAGLEMEEQKFHGILIPNERGGRKRLFFINPHSVCPKSNTSLLKFGFLEIPREVCVGKYRTGDIKAVEKPETKRKVPVVKVSDIPKLKLIPANVCLPHKPTNVTECAVDDDDASVIQLLQRCNVPFTAQGSVPIGEDEAVQIPEPMEIVPADQVSLHSPQISEQSVGLDDMDTHSKVPLKDMGPAESVSNVVAEKSEENLFCPYNKLPPISPPLMPLINSLNVRRRSLVN